MSFGNQGARVWRKTGEREMPKCLKSSVKYPQSVMVWGAMSAAGVGPLCFVKGRVNAASYQEILEHFMLSSAEKLYGDEDFIFQHNLAPAHSAKTTGKWFTDHGITVLNWPANSPDLNPIQNLWDIVKRKLRDARPNTLDELKAAIEASWASITPQQCHRLIASVYVDTSMSHSRQCGEAIKKANRMLGYISRCVEYKSREVMLRLYNSLVRPHLEYCVQVWSPYLKKDIVALEKVERRATKMIPGLRGMSYEERLLELNLFSLKQRRLRGDMIQVYKILTGLDAVQANSYFSISLNTRTRGHRWKLAGEHFKLDLRKHFFTQRVVRVWNTLPDNVVQAESLGSFKSELDKILMTLSY
ncbi:uncharacterized protein LOC125721830 isoform X1 [Brienomyrus brachyistius]|uniref:uncharacterized protein LOC125721830 isoform X1 n=1 Tax=Brienomyrus brachyistius TaxID=42636 RepID=UPI0020B2C9FA|nr:uncharacterized protein LOC125721830 isoform X1 [Brienomyrus brachyistius]XP_048853902.1 uncharacterized protein LOC125721830 isoform X1 [Brienomyrus brachyistius]XP_048853903.1 uncharacterized protein LOC125721830 isoform X1 [Brienomyrus brachyistius]XP_048853904.1 uncharacterized protein LOC125721830 isoform X1 [Brienomyrus brachyistius]XP_048853905.1 uncharacterized protein LOC125721830 isoform X1 [Brienomyrus brachyistius]XP_048853906.1 uncharacterized protein LOC125721830 isoform X1 [B